MARETFPRVGRRASIQADGFHAGHARTEGTGIREPVAGRPGRLGAPEAVFGGRYGPGSGYRQPRSPRRRGECRGRSPGPDTGRGVPAARRAAQGEGRLCDGLVARGAGSFRGAENRRRQAGSGQEPRQIRRGRRIEEEAFPRVGRPESVQSDAFHGAHVSEGTGIRERVAGHPARLGAPEAVFGGRYGPGAGFSPPPSPRRRGERPGGSPGPDTGRAVASPFASTVTNAGTEASTAAAEDAGRAVARPFAATEAATAAEEEALCHLSFFGVGIGNGISGLGWECCRGVA